MPGAAQRQITKPNVSAVVPFSRYFLGTTTRGRKWPFPNKLRRRWPSSCPISWGTPLSFQARPQRSVDDGLDAIFRPLHSLGKPCRFVRNHKPLAECLTCGFICGLLTAIVECAARSQRMNMLEVVMAFGLGKKWWKRASGLSNVQRQLSKQIGVPLSGRKSFKTGCGSTMLGILAVAIALACFWIV